MHRRPIATAISAILSGFPLAQAQQTDANGGGLTEVVVTAQKVIENLQDVPLSIQVLDGAKLEQLSIVNLDDYVKYMPSVSYQRGQGEGSNGQPGDSHVYIRGVVSGGDGNHSGSQPGVGTYLDEQPVTTIDGTVDVHIYDIERIEVLEGPQGTLYGASSESGTIRIITNKPDVTAFKAGYDVNVNSVDHGGTGYEAEGFVNLPLTPVAAIRLVGWDEKDAGYISNVAGTNKSACIQDGVRTFPTWDGYPSAFPAITPCPPTPGPIGHGAISDAAYVKNDYNTVETRGGRGALKLLLGDNWTVTPTVMGQSMDSEGFFGYDPAVGDLQLAHFGPESNTDNWTQAALTVEGKMSNFDLVYAGAYMKRTRHAIADYSDYSVFYDRVFGSGAVWDGNNGKPVMPQELVIGTDHFEKWSHELRLSTPQDLPVKATVGLFIERQLHDILQLYTMPGFDFTNPNGDNPNGFAYLGGPGNTGLSLPHYPNAIWLTDQQRVDRDQAAFGQATWDMTSHLSLNGGIRFFKYDNSLEGFYGYSSNYENFTGYLSEGMNQCFGPATVQDSPCTDLNKTVSGSGTVPRLNLTYKIDPDRMVYATYSKGFRPGGVNRTSVADIGPYAPDYLTNYEIGWKTQWFDRHLRWNGAFFWEDWKNFQFSFLGPNSLTIIENGGNARIKGVESDIEWVPTRALMLSLNFTLLDPVLLQNYCGTAGVTNCPNQVTTPSFGPEVIGPIAPAGTNLPVSPKFKANAIARYSFVPVANWEPYAQAAYVYQTQTSPNLLLTETNVIGMQPAYGLLDLSAGAQKNRMTIQLLVSNVADKRAQLSRFTETNPLNDNQVYIIPSQPRTFTLQFGQRF
jgi:outer membrane receptor protein involved in Fe transport